MAKRRKNITERSVQETESKAPGDVALAFKPEDEPEGHGFGDDGLTERQRMFVAAYIGPAAGNASRAAKMAGYSDSNSHVLQNTASRLLGFVGVQRALARARADKLGGPEWTKAGIVEIADSNMAAFYKVNERGQKVLDMDAAYEAHAMGLVKEVHEEVISGGDGPVAVIKRRVKLYDRLAALQLLAKMHGMLVDRVEDVTPAKPSPVGRLLTNPKAFRAARELAAAMGPNDEVSEDAESSNGNGHRIDPARN